MGRSGSGRPTAGSTAAGGIGVGVARRITTVAVTALTLGVWITAMGRAAQEAHPPQPHRHPAAQALVNPVPRSEASIAAGRAMYARHCVRCHGPRGKGDGGGAGGGGIPSDLTDEVWDHGSSDGEVFVVLRDGTSVDMEGYGERLSETELWQLVNYLSELRTKN